MQGVSAPATCTMVSEAYLKALGEVVIGLLETSQETERMIIQILEAVDPDWAEQYEQRIVEIRDSHNTTAMFQLWLDTL